MVSADELFDLVRAGYAAAGLEVEEECVTLDRITDGIRGVVEVIQHVNGIDGVGTEWGATVIKITGDSNLYLLRYTFDSYYGYDFDNVRIEKINPNQE